MNANVSSWIFIMWMSDDDYAWPPPEAHVGRHRVTIWRTLISKTLVGGQTKPRRQNITRPELCNRSLQVHRRPLLLTQSKALYLSSSFRLPDKNRHKLLNFLIVGKVKRHCVATRVWCVAVQPVVPVCGKKAMAAAGWAPALLCCVWSWKLEVWGLDSLLRGSYTTLAWPSCVDSGWQAVWLSRTGVGREAGKKRSRCSLVYLGVVGASPADCRETEEEQWSWGGVTDLGDPSAALTPPLPLLR